MILKDKIINGILIIRQNRAVLMQKKFVPYLKYYNFITDNKKLEVLLKSQTKGFR